MDRAKEDRPRYLEGLPASKDGSIEPLISIDYMKNIDEELEIVRYYQRMDFMEFKVNKKCRTFFWMLVNYNIDINIQREHYYKRQEFLESKALPLYDLLSPSQK